MSGQPQTDHLNASERFLAAVDEQLDTEGPIDLSKALTQFERATRGRVHADHLEAIQSEARSLETTFAQYATQFNRAMAVRQARVRRAALCLALDTATTEFKDDDQLAGAEQAVQEMESLQKNILAALHEAITRADTERFLQLRPEAEVVVPTRLAEAKERLARLQLGRAEAEASRVEGRASRDAEAASAAKAAADAAAAAAASAADKATQAAELAASSRGNAARAALRVDELRDDLGRQAARHAESERERLRRLVGLESSPTEQAPPPKPDYVFDTGPVIRPTAGSPRAVGSRAAPFGTGAPEPFPYRDPAPGRLAVVDQP
ncbi:hypothetical protein [Blastococcus xanthinilyticus]|uniref:Uncharacterized protein n=1 Tax=Blastococcus xanthinilyticus TaxID=1564164 RepID=A0A5S5CZC1_9ACTN|nr:hypothetical protein [Blastococcus xanthinilyticus]TYP88434.1 hypothetical protein BD833_104138 [Blastococcus xanthinilyticus]